jgi:xanthine/uracil permease
VIALVTSALLVAVNSLATMGTVSAAARRPLGPADFRRGSMVTGLSHAVQGLVPGAGSVPRADSAALAALDPRLARRSLVLGCVGLAIAAAVPQAVGVLVRLPPALAADVLLAVMGSLTLLAFRGFGRTRWSPGRWAALALALGLGGALVPGPPAWLPDQVEHLANPIFVGVGIALAAEAVLSRGGVPAPPRRGRE